MNYTSDFAKLSSMIDSLSSTKKTKEDDKSYWKIQKDKSGNGIAVIRFLPELPDQLPIVRLFNHYFQVQETKKWVIGNCPTTLGDKCACCESYFELYHQSEEATDKSTKVAIKKLADSRKRKLNYIANILVISDPVNPENEGKVFKYRFGKKIYDKIIAKIQPQFDIEEKVNPFDPVNGANFVLKATTTSMGDGIETLNYDNSEFKTVSDITSDPKYDFDEILKQRYDLSEEISPDKIETYESMSVKFNRALTGNNVTANKPKTNVEQEPVNSKGLTAEEVSEVEDTTEETPEKVNSTTKTKPIVEEDDEDEDSKEYFERLSKM